MALGKLLPMPIQDNDEDDDEYRYRRHVKINRSNLLAPRQKVNKTKQGYKEVGPTCHA